MPDQHAVVVLNTDGGVSPQYDFAPNASPSFILDAAYREAESVLLDQRLFFLDRKARARFAAALGQRPTLGRLWDFARGALK